MSYAVAIEVLIDLPDARNLTEAKLKSESLKDFIGDIADNVLNAEIMDITEYEVEG